MSFLRSRFVQAVLVLVIAFVVLRFGIQPPAPWSVLTLYMSIVLLAVLVFVSSDSDSWREFVRPIRATLVSPDRRHTRLGLLIVLASLIGLQICIVLAPLFIPLWVYGTDASLFSWFARTVGGRCGSGCRALANPDKT